MSDIQRDIENVREIILNGSSAIGSITTASLEVLRKFIDDLLKTSYQMNENLKMAGIHAAAVSGHAPDKTMAQNATNILENQAQQLNKINQQQISKMKNNVGLFGTQTKAQQSAQPETKASEHQQSKRPSR